jgi:ActR/RegA family two-component response regulator
MSMISWKDDLAIKLNNLRNNYNTKWEKIEYSLDEIGIAISEYINKTNHLDVPVQLHKQTVSRILEKTLLMEY